MNAWKEESALRIMEALSGVDEELLERSGQTGRKKEQAPGRRGRFGWMSRYGGLCAAGLCLAVLGAAWWSLTGENGLSGTGSDSANEMIMQEEAGAAADRETDENGPESAGEPEESMSESGYSPEEPCWLDVDMLEADSARELNGEAENVQELQQASGDEAAKTETEALQQGASEEEKQNLPEEDRSSKKTEAISWEAARALGALGSYVPAELPEGYAFLEGERSTVPRNSIRLTWGNGEHRLWLKLTETELTAELPESRPEIIFAGEENWQSRIPAPDEDGSVRFALLYEDGVLLEYKGWLTTEELEELLGKRSESRDS